MSTRALHTYVRVLIMQGYGFAEFSLRGLAHMSNIRHTGSGNGLGHFGDAVIDGKGHSWL